MHVLIYKMNCFMGPSSEYLTYIVKLDMVHDSGEMCFCGNLLRNKLRIFVVLIIHITTLPMIHSLYVRTLTNTFTIKAGSLLL